MKYFVIRRKKDKVFYCKNWNHHKTGDTLPLHGFFRNRPPFLYRSYERADHATMTNLVLQRAECEILQWSTRAMKVISTEPVADNRLRAAE